MSENSEAVKKWRETSKQRMIDSMGGKCQLCGYSRCNDSLEFHHLNPNQKDLSFGGIRANIVSWAKIVIELRKCILLCSNCHKEVHRGISQIPKEFSTFDEDFSDYRKLKIVELGKGDTNFKNCRCVYYDKCPGCGKLKPAKNKWCSLKCDRKNRRKVDWDKIELSKMFDQYKNKSKIAKILGVSEHLIRKRLKECSRVAKLVDAKNC